MSIVFNEKSQTFHLFNSKISYIMGVLPNGHMGQLYFGKRIHQKEDYTYLLEMVPRPMGSYVFEGKTGYTDRRTTDSRRLRSFRKTGAGSRISAIRAIL